MLVHLLPCAYAALVKAAGFPHLKFFTQTDKCNVGADAGVGAKRFRKHDASILVEGKDVYFAIERDREPIPLVRIIRKAVEKAVDFLRKALAACIEGWSVKRGVAINAPGITVALEPSAEGSGDGDAPLGVDLVGECRDKAIHPLLLTNANPNLDSRAVERAVRPPPVSSLPVNASELMPPIRCPSQAPRSDRSDTPL